MDEQAVHGLERTLRQVLVRAVDRVPRLEADDAAPALLGEERARLGRVSVELRKRRLEPLEDGHRPGDVTVVLGVEAGYAWVVSVGRPEGLLGLAVLVVLVDLLDVQDRQRATRPVGERDPVPGQNLVDRETDRKRPRQAAGQAHLLEDALVVLSTHETGQRRKRAGREHVQVGELARREAHRLERLDALRPLARALDQLPSVRPNQARGGRHHQTRTSP
jgi:hypothetical protein